MNVPDRIFPDGLRIPDFWLAKYRSPAHGEVPHLVVAADSGAQVGRWSFGGQNGLRGEAGQYWSRGGCDHHYGRRRAARRQQDCQQGEQQTG